MTAIMAFVPGAPCCGPPGCTLHLLVLGCPQPSLAGSVVGGVSVSLHPVGDPGTTIASGTSTWASGSILGNLTLTAPAGTYLVTATHPRFADFSAEIELTCDGLAGDAVVQLDPDVVAEQVGDYVCPCAGCSAPISTTLRLYNGHHDITVTWDGSAWVGAVGDFTYLVQCEYDPESETYSFGLHVEDAGVTLGGLYSATGSVCACPPTSPGILIEFPSGITMGPPGSPVPDESWTTVVHEPGLLPDAPAQACFRVHDPDCGETPGDPRTGLTVTLHHVGNPTPVGTCVTDGDGQCCIDLDGWGGYEATVDDGAGCVVTVAFSANPCEHEAGSTVDVDVPVCCATACVLVIDDATDLPIEGAEVDFGEGLGTATTDASGIACLTLTTARMLGLPTAGGDCTVRRMGGVHVTAEVGDPLVVYLDRCVDVDVACGADGSSPTEVRMAAIPDGFLIGPAGCCEDQGCAVVGPNLRGLVPEQADVTLSIVVKDSGTLATEATYDWSGFVTLDFDAFDDGAILYDSGCVTGAVIDPDPISCDMTTKSYPYGRLKVRFCQGEGAGDPQFSWGAFVSSSCPDGTEILPVPDCLSDVIRIVSETITDGGDVVGHLCYSEAVDSSWSFEYLGHTIEISLQMTPHEP